MEMRDHEFTWPWKGL